MIKPVDRLAVFERAGGRCALCGHPLRWTDFDVDHIVPVSAGGGDDHANLRAAHIHCNRSRGNAGYPVVVRRRGSRRLNIEVYPDEEELLRRVKADAALRDQSLHDWMFDAIRQRLEAPAAGEGESLTGR